MQNPISDDDEALIFFEDSGTIYITYNGSQFFEKRKFPKMAGYASPLILSGVNSFNL